METVDTLKNGYKIIQDTERFQFGIDAILLANFASSEIRKNETVIDLGTGTGIIPLLLEKSSFAKELTGLEIQTESADMAFRSVELNHLEDKIHIVQGDIKNVSQQFGCHSFNVVTSNPPYMIVEHGRQNPAEAKTIARHEILCNLEDVVSAADYLLKPHGRFFMIHRPFRLPEIFASLLKHNLEPKRMQLIHPFVDKEPNIVLVEARKNANPRLKIEKPLVVYEKPGKYTQEILDIYN